MGPIALIFVTLIVYLGSKGRLQTYLNLATQASQSGNLGQSLTSNIVDPLTKMLTAPVGPTAPTIPQAKGFPG